MQLDRVVHLRGVLRTVYVIPSVCSVVALALLWKLIYRGDYGLSRQMNLIHGSDSPESAARELKLFFGK